MDKTNEKSYAGFFILNKFIKLDSASNLRQNHLFSVLVVFMAFAHTYCIPGSPITFGELLMFACLPFYYKQGMGYPLSRPEFGFILWFVYMAIISMVMGIVFDAPLTKYINIARTFFYWFIIFFLGKNLFNRKVFEKSMIIFSIVLSVFILVQFFVYMLTGFYIPGLFFNLPISNGSASGLDTYLISLRNAYYFGFIRPHGFLPEPAHVSQILFISVIALVCNKEITLSKKTTLFALFSAAVIVTLSTTGIVLFGFACFLFLSVEKKLSVYRVPLVLMIIIIGFYVFLSDNDSSFSSIDRIVNIINGSDIDKSSDARLNNGMNLFSDLPFVYKIFGTGLGLYQYVLNDLGFKDADLYMNTFSSIFFYTGSVGGVIWFVSLITFFVMSGLLGKSLVLGFFIVTLGCNPFCQPQMIWFFLLILADIKEKNDRYSCTKLQ